jgi:surface antigen
MLAALALVPAAGAPPAADAAIASVAAVRPHIEAATRAVSPERDGGLTIRAYGAGVCSLYFSGPRHPLVGPFVTKVTRPNIEWTWQVPANASRGRWYAHVKCARSKAALHAASVRTIATPVLVRGWRRSERAAIVSALRVRTLSSRPRAFAARSAGGLGYNPFPYGQCTYHAYQTRSDIYDYATSHGVPLGGVASSAYYGGYPDYTWNAWHWLGNAQEAGIPTGDRPIAGALVVFPRGYGGSAVGHVGYVERVNGNGSYVVSEMNWNGDPNVSERLVPRGVPGVGFVYGGHAGDGPPPR